MPTELDLLTRQIREATTHDGRTYRQIAQFLIDQGWSLTQGDSPTIVAALGHPKPKRFQAQFRRAAKYAKQYPYHQGMLDALRLVAVDLGYTHSDIESWKQ